MADMREQEIKTSANAASRPKPYETEENLDDDRSMPTSDFVGATLQLDPAAPGTDPGVEFRGPGMTGSSATAMNRERPGSTMSRKSTTSSGSRTSMSAKLEATQTEYSSKMFFARKKDGNFENAVESIRDALVRNDLDGDVRGAWLLTEIDHWDNEREKVLLLTDHSLIIVKYDFITAKCIDHKRVLLHIIDKVMVGDLVYPEKSLMAPRQHGGVRVSWAQGQDLTFGQKWNPWCTDLPFTTFAHHPLIYNEKDRETVTYNVDDFYESLIQGISTAYRSKNPGKSVMNMEGPIMIESYASVSSMIFNQSHLGFNRDRNGVSF